MGRWLADHLAGIGSGLDDFAIQGLNYAQNNANRKDAAAQRQFANDLAQARFSEEQVQNAHQRTYDQLRAENDLTMRDQKNREMGIKETEEAGRNGRKQLEAILATLSGGVLPEDKARILSEFDKGGVPAALAAADGVSKRFLDQKVQIAGGEGYARTAGGNAADKKQALEQAKYQSYQDALSKGMTPEAALMEANKPIPEGMTPKISARVGLSPEQQAAKDDQSNVMNRAKNHLKMMEKQPGFDPDDATYQALNLAIMSGNPDAVRNFFGAPARGRSFAPMPNFVLEP